MTIVDVLKKRSAVRAYQDVPVAKELIEKIFAQASLCASNCNTQPWHVSIVSGQARADLETALVAHVSSGTPPNPIFEPVDYGVSQDLKQRQVDCAMALYDAVGVERSDKPERFKLMLKNWQFFGAPHVAIFSMHKQMKEINAVDVGIYLQTVMLLMVEAGLACCPQGALAFYPDPIFKIADIPEDNGILFGMSFGYADETAQINNVETDRVAFDGFANFVE